MLCRRDCRILRLLQVNCSKARRTKQKADTMLLQFLALYQRACEAFWPLWEVGKQYVREWLGPAPQTWWLLPDGRVLPGTIALPNEVYQSAIIYIPATHKLVQAAQTESATPNTAVRYRRLPYVSLVVTHPRFGMQDVSDWANELRGAPGTLDLPLKQLLTLWCLSANTYSPITETTVRVTKSDGEEETHVY